MNKDLPLLEDWLQTEFQIMKMLRFKIYLLMYQAAIHLQIYNSIQKMFN